MDSELYDLETDPGQERNLIAEHPEVAAEMRSLWIDFLKEHDASEERIRPFVDGQDASPTPRDGRLFGFRDDLGQFVAFDSEEQARGMAHREGFPGSPRRVESTTFGAVLDENPKNLIFLAGQYYWAEDLA
jgi:hypothetical protein